MLRIYGIKTDLNTGEIIKERSIIFRCITPEAYKKRGKHNAALHGYTVTEIYTIGELSNGFRDIKIFG